MLKKAAMMTLIVFSLSSCSTLEIVHSDLDLPCVPDHGVYFSIGETDGMSEELYNKFKKIIITYKQRILTQCSLTKEHNVLHN